MDFSWLADLFGNFLTLFNPLKRIRHWTLWAELAKVYAHLKRAIDWYRAHVIARMKAIGQLQRQIFNTFIRPALVFLDTIRRMTHVVGLVNKKLAAKLDAIFFRAETYVLLPLNLLNARINSYARIFQAFLTPLGYFDRATLLNSFWRDANLLRRLLTNPLGAILPGVGIGPGTPFDDTVKSVVEYAASDSGPIASAADASFSTYLQLIGIKR